MQEGRFFLAYCLENKKGENKLPFFVARISLALILTVKTRANKVNIKIILLIKYDTVSPRYNNPRWDPLVVVTS